MATLVRVEGNIKWDCFPSKTGKHWIGVCEPLKLTVQAETWGELMEDIALTLDSILNDLLSSNELDRFLRDRGWHIQGRLPARLKDVRFDVPFIPVALMEAHGGSQRSVS
jgi:hypothetical protein